MLNPITYPAKQPFILPLMMEPGNHEDISLSSPVRIKTQTNYWLEETLGGLSTIDRVDAWLRRQTHFELIDPERVAAFLREHPEILHELDTVAHEIFSAFTDSKGRKPELSLKPGHEISEEGETPREYLVIWVWVKIKPKEASQLERRFDDWWLNQPRWLREALIIDVSFERDG